MAKIYISSTYVDLKNEREAADKAIQCLEHQVIAMENYAASDQRPVDKCLQDVRGSDAYVGIFAWRYGFIPGGYDKSITHLEYETAKKTGIPCLVFLLDEDTPWPPKYMTDGEERQKILRLRDELKRDHVVKFFKNADELSGLVGDAVGNLISMAERSFIQFKSIGDLTGTRLGKYVILEKLGKGGKGVVFKVMDTLEESEKAVKMVPPRIADSPAAFKDLKREINTAARIIHANVVKVLGLEEVDGRFFIVMEYIEGRSLEQVLADSQEGKLEETQVIDIMKKLALGLLETHKKNVIHRDIKPSNVMLTPDGQVKILDFGISYQVTTSMTELVGEHHRTGTWPYMAPEQLSTRYGRENKQVDIWGFGVTMYQLLTGKFPFVDKDQIKDRKEKPYEMTGVSREARNLVMKCLEKDRENRFQNMEEVLAALDAVTMAKVKEKAKIKIKKENRLKWMLMTAAVIVLVVLSVFLIDRPGQGDKPPGEKHEPVKTQVPVEKTIQKNEEMANPGKDQADKHLQDGDIKAAREKLESAKKIDVTGETQRLEKQINEKEIEQKEHEKYAAAAQNYYDKGEYDKALENISRAEKIKITGPLKKLKVNIQAKIEEKAQIQAKIEEEKQKELKKQDDLAYEKAFAQNTIAAYQAYLDEYLSGSHVNEAGNKITELKKMPGDVRKVAAGAAKGIKVYEIKKDLWEADYGGGIKMVYIPAGNFTMGSNDYEDEKPPHEVILDGYWLGKTEVTVQQYMQFVNETQSHYPEWLEAGNAYNIKTGSNDYYKKFVSDEKCPIVGVSWEDAGAYCDWLSTKKSSNFKLPTEAQWEKAARGNDARKYPWGVREPDDTLSNFNSKIGKTTPVGSYPAGASPYGLMDMAGNVWEWCSDWYGLYDARYQRNPTGPAGGTDRVMRGGGWSNYARYLRCSGRLYGRPALRYYYFGFRLCQDN